VPVPSPTRPWWRRRRPRLSVRALSIAVLILGGWLGWLVRRARIQREVVAAIERGGGAVGYDWEYDEWKWPGIHYRPSGPPVFRQPVNRSIPAWRRWLIDRFGPDAFADVKVVQVGLEDPDLVMAQVARLGRVAELQFIDGTGVSDAGFRRLRDLTCLEVLVVPARPGLNGASLKHIEGLSRLRSLRFEHDFPLTDADLIHLRGLTGLQRLEFWDSYPGRKRITDAGLAHLAGLVDLRYLYLSGQPVTSAGLAHLRGMTRLEGLILNSTRVADLAPIRGLRNLRLLTLYRAPITDAGLAPVAGFTALEILRLPETAISDDGLVHLRGLKRLAWLDLHDSRATDAGMPHLAGLSALQALGLTRTRVTAAGWSHLAGIPGLKPTAVNPRAAPVAPAAAVPPGGLAQPSIRRPGG
jgi:hypothetical protein